MKVTITTGPANYIDLIAEDLEDAGKLVTVATAKYALENRDRIVLMPTNCQPAGVTLRFFLVTPA